MFAKLKKSAVLLCLLHGSLAFGQLVSEPYPLDPLVMPQRHRQPEDREIEVTRHEDQPVEPLASQHRTGVEIPQPRLRPPFSGARSAGSVSLGRITTTVEGGTSTLPETIQRTAAFRFVTGDDNGVDSLNTLILRGPTTAADIDMREIPAPGLQISVTPLTSAHDGEYFIDTFRIIIAPRIQASMIQGGDNPDTSGPEEDTSNMRLTLGTDVVARILHLDPDAVRGRVISAWIQARAGLASGLAAGSVRDDTVADEAHHEAVVGLNMGFEGFIKLRVSRRTHLQFRGRFDAFYNLLRPEITTGENSHSSSMSLEASVSRMVGSESSGRELVLSVEASQRRLGSVGDLPDGSRAENAASISYIGGSVGAAF